MRRVLCLGLSLVTMAWLSPATRGQDDQEGEKKESDTSRLDRLEALVEKLAKRLEDRDGPPVFERGRHEEKDFFHFRIFPPERDHMWWHPFEGHAGDRLRKVLRWSWGGEGEGEGTLPRLFKITKEGDNLKVRLRLGPKTYEGTIQPVPDGEEGEEEGEEDSGEEGVEKFEFFFHGAPEEFGEGAHSRVFLKKFVEKLVPEEERKLLEEEARHLEEALKRSRARLEELAHPKEGDQTPTEEKKEEQK